VWQQAECQKCISVLLTAYAQMKISPIAELPVELAIITYCGDISILTQPSVQKSSNEAQKTPIIEKKDLSEVVKKSEEKEIKPVEETHDVIANDDHMADFVTLEKLQECWKDVIEALKPYNHSVAGVMRSAKPFEVGHGVITISTQYAFHQERLSEPKVRDILATVFKKLFGIKVRVEVVLKK
jgi:DNA polymerase-3 subunit gamma/tau